MSAPRRPSERIFGLLTGVVLAIVIVLVLSPAILTVVLSFSNDPSISFPPKSWGVERYIQLFSDTVWLEPLWLSVRLSLASAALSVTLGLGVLIAVHRSRMPFRNVLEQASLIALILPVSAYAVAMYVVFVKFGLLGTAFGLILANTVIALPFVVLVGSVALRQLPGDFELVAFTLGAFFAGIAGALFAHLKLAIDPRGFDFFRSVEIVVIVILGGMGNTLGVILAAILLTLLPEFLRPVAEYRMVIYAALLIGLMLIRPQGLFNFRLGRART